MDIRKHFFDIQIAFVIMGIVIFAYNGKTVVRHLLFPSYGSRNPLRMTLRLRETEHQTLGEIRYLHFVDYLTVLIKLPSFFRQDENVLNI